MTTIDDTYEHHDSDPGSEVTECRFRTVLEDLEVKCVVRGHHTVHRYIAPRSGIVYRFEIVGLDGTPL